MHVTRTYGSLLTFTLAVLATLVFTAPATLHAAEPDWGVYSDILKKNVGRSTVDGIRTNFVNYAGIKADARWPGVVKMIAEYPAANLKTRREKLAFYINAYNILVINLIVQNHPVSDINKLGTSAQPVWKKTAGTVAGRAVSLDYLEHKIVRPFGDARIHFALNCAALSCPDLRNEAYTAAKLYEQLWIQTNSFLKNSGKGVRVDEAQKTVHVTKLFEWFAEDFKGGTEAFVRKYRKDIPAGYKYVTDIEYRWRLNGK